MNAGTLYDAIAEVSPIVRCSIGVADERSTWTWEPGANATQAQKDAGDNVVATIPIEPLGLVPTGDFIARWTNAEYLALQKRRTTDNGKMAKDWDNVTSDASINMNKKKTQTLKTNLVTGGILTQVRADEIFS